MAQIGEISVEITADISDLQRDLQRASRELSNFGSRMESIGSRMGAAFDRMTDRMGRVSERMRDLGSRGREMGENMVDMGENMMQGITVPLAAIAAGAVKASFDMSRLGSIVKANMAGVKGSIEEVRGVAEKVFRAGLGKDAEEVGRAVALIKRNFNDLNETQLTDLAMQIHGVAEALGTDASSVLEDVIELTQEYKVTTQQALDLVAAGYDVTSLKGKNLSQVLKEVSGSAKQMSATMQKDPTVVWRGNLRNLLATLTPLGDELLKIANDYLPKVTSAIQKAVGWFSRQSDATKKMIVGFAAFAAVLPFITITLGALIMMGSQVAAAFGTLTGWLSRAGKAISTFVQNYKGLSSIGPLAWIGIVVAGLIALYNASKTFADFVNKTFAGVWKSLQATFASFSSSLTPLKASFDTLVSSLKTLWQTIEPLAVLLGTVIVGAVVATIAVINGLLNMLAPLINVIANVITAVVALVNAFLSLLTLDFSGFAKNFNVFVEAFVSILMGFVDTVIAFFTGLWNTLVQVFAQFGINLNAQAIAIFSSLYSSIVGALSTLGSFFVGLWNGIKGTTMVVWNGVKSFLSGVWSSIKSTASSVWNGVKSAITNAVNSTASALSSAWSRIKSAAQSAWNSIRSTAVSAWNSIKSTVTSAMHSITSAVQSGFSRARSAVSSAASSIRSILSSLAASAFSWGANLGSMFARGIQSAIGRAVAAARSAAAKIKSYLGWSSPTKEGPGKDSDKWAPNLMNMLAAGIQAGIPKVQASVDSVASVISEVQPLDSEAPSGSNNTINVYPQRANLNPAQLMRELQRASRLNGGGII